MRLCAAVAMILVAAAACGPKTVAPVKREASVTVCPAAVVDDQPWAKELFPACPSAPFTGKVDVCNGGACPHPCRVTEGEHVLEIHYGLTGLWEETRLVDGVHKDDLLQLKCRRDDASGRLATCERVYINNLEFADRIVRDAHNEITAVDNDQEHIAVVRDSNHRVSKLHLPHATVSFDYDPDGRLVRETRDGAVTTYSYNPDGRLAEKTDANHRTTYDYGPDTRRIMRIHEHDHVGRDDVQTLAYDADGRLVRIDRPGGVSTTYQYDCH